MKDVQAVLIIIPCIAIAVFAFAAGWQRAKERYAPRRDTRGRFAR